MDADKIEIHTDPLNHNLMGKLDQMRPKADPIPLAKGRALVFGTGAAGIALIIAACAMSWGYVQENKRAETAQAAQIQANRKKAVADAEIEKLKAEAEADVAREMARAKVAIEPAMAETEAKVTDNTNVVPEPTPTQSVPKFPIISGEGDKTDIRTTFTIFKERSFAGGSVVTGLSFKNSAAKTPSDQFCYFTRSVGVATSDRLELGVYGKQTNVSHKDRQKIKLSEKQVLQAREMCQWYHA